MFHQKVEDSKKNGECPEKSNDVASLRCAFELFDANFFNDKKNCCVTMSCAVFVSMLLRLRVSPTSLKSEEYRQLFRLPPDEVSDLRVL
uniref:Uncharacterized protein n=1 Tax=Quercus lobata TaxID=97700 RepID=A0A7N2R0I5_QUELO